ncbi:MAG TPA: pyrroloquinoline quinone biosynthesis peptide chaperone PqqD [Verrucomicrobiae bacterium]|jgi:coenzyme PQQ biosynthesis protein PqqD|nr:pyrroloquinoline quinone biosynthesis peptide chaperone PqqD [Verrucomicrobiae bacterium]
MISLTQHSRPALARGVRLRDDPITGEPILLYPEGVLELDETTHEIVRRCSGKATLESIVLSLAEDYEIDAGTLQRDVCECLEQLRERMLIAVSE